MVSSACRERRNQKGYEEFISIKQIGVAFIIEVVSEATPNIQNITFYFFEKTILKVSFFNPLRTTF